MKNLFASTILIIAVLITGCGGDKAPDSRAESDNIFVNCLQEQKIEKLSALIPTKEVLDNIANTTSKKKIAKRVTENPDESIAEVKTNAEKIYNSILDKLAKNAINSNTLKLTDSTIKESESKGITYVDNTLTLLAGETKITIVLSEMIKINGGLFFFFDSSVRVKGI